MGRVARHRGLPVEVGTSRRARWGGAFEVRLELREAGLPGRQSGQLEAPRRRQGPHVPASVRPQQSRDVVGTGDYVDAIPVIRHVGQRPT